jgi:hypothetical protein
MKIGIEVEGRLRGVKTLFIGAAELELEGPSGIRAKMMAHNVTHLYVSDHNNVVDYETLGLSFYSLLVTLDVTRVKPGPRPQNVSIMLTLPYEFFIDVDRLAADDQVKFHSVDRDVLCVSARHLVRTQPIEFCGDVEVR